MRIFLKLFLFSVVFICISAASVFSSSIDVTIQPLKKKIFLGDKVYFNISINSDDKILKISDNLTEEFKAFSIENIKKKISSNSALFTFCLQFFNTGKIILPKAEFIIKTKDNTLKIYTDNIKVNILSNLSDNSTFRPIKKPVPVQFYLTQKEWLFLLTIIVIFVLLAIFLYRFIKNKKKPVKNFKEQSPFEELKEGLKKCKLFLEENNIRLFYFCISEITRRYLDRKFHVSTLEATLKEIRKIFEKEPAIPDEFKEELFSLFKNWEIYKFTGNTPGEEEALKHLNRIIEITEKIETENYV